MALIRRWARSASVFQQAVEEPGGGSLAVGTLGKLRP
jgi:hypothetical protein